MNSEDKIRKMEALISLVDEPDPAVFKEISQSILDFGSEIVPFLEHAWEEYYHPEMQKRIEDLIHTIQYSQICEDLENWLQDGAKNLLEACIMIARYQYPNLKEHLLEYELAKIRKDVWLELNNNLTALEQIKVFNYVFYDIHGFHGNVDNYHSPENSFINKVLESKSGNPLSLSIIYMLIAQSLDLPVKGVNLPEHFVLAYTGSSLDPNTLEYKENQVLFYINVFSKGNVFSFKDIESFLKQLKQQPSPAYYNPCDNTAIVYRMINNLLTSYKKSNENHKYLEIKKIASIFENQMKNNTQ